MFRQVGSKKPVESDIKERIVSLFTQGYSQRTIGKFCHCSGSTVGRLIKKFVTFGVTDRKTGSGRPRKTTAKTDRLIVRQVKMNRKVNSYTIKKDYSLDYISVHTIRRRITESGMFKSYWATRKPFISEKNRLIRLQWCRDRENWTVEQWRKVLWSDESPFVLRCAKRYRVWRLHNERYNPAVTRATVKHDKKIMVWGCFTAHGVGNLKK